MARRKAGRPPVYGVAKKPSSISFHPDLLNEVDKVAQERSKTRSQMLEYMAAVWLNREDLLREVS